MKKTTVIAVIFLAFCLLSKSYAQKSSGIIRMGVALPLFEFADNNIKADNEGGAAPGYNAGLQYIYTGCSCGVGMFVSMDMNYNSLQKQYKEKLKFPIGDFLVQPSEMTYSHYLNIPVAAGVNYTIKGDHTDLLANAGVVVNFLKMGSTEAEYFGMDVIQKSGLGTGIGLKAGFAVLVNKKIAISADYYALGTYILESNTTRKDDGTRFTNPDINLKVNMLTLTVGYRF